MKKSQIEHLTFTRNVDNFSIPLFVGLASDHSDDDGDDNDDDFSVDDIYIMMKCLSVCLSVTKNDHFLLGVSCNHLNHP